MTMQSYDLARAFVDTLGGSPIWDFRAIHDRDKGAQACPFRGTLDECWNDLVRWNNAGYGIFAVISEMNGAGRTLDCVQATRAHYVDMDSINAMQHVQAANGWTCKPSFVVYSSPNKAHVYWKVNQYRDNDRFNVVQRKLRQLYDGDGAVIDPTRVMRLPGTLHQKGEPHLVTCAALSGYGQTHDVAMLEVALWNVDAFEHGDGQRQALGSPELAAPSLDWLRFALSKLNPNEQDRSNWISITSAFKQAGWTLASEDELFAIWSEWCANYNVKPNDPAENLKQWNSIRNTEVGWKSFERRVPTLVAYMKMGFKQAPTPQPVIPMPEQSPNPVIPMPEPQQGTTGPILDARDQMQYFANCHFVIDDASILTPDGSMLNATQFNGAYGGKLFVITDGGTTTDEPWKAALRSTLWTVPKVHHTRFLPHLENGAIVVDPLNRKGINTYRKSNIVVRSGEIDPFMRHIMMMLPVEADRKILFDYMAHNIKYPGHKIPWAPLIQSTEGVGKNVIKYVMRHAMGGISRVHFPNAQELIEGGSKFNAWMRSKLFIICDEIRVDEKRDMIEILKPMISEEQIEIQAKGHDQKTEDNYSNWLFFSNYKDAVPINRSSRRWSIFYSPIQSIDDIRRYGLTTEYFDGLYDWLKKGGGLEQVANWFMEYPLGQGEIPMRAPDTSSTPEALIKSRGPIEIAIAEAVEDRAPGFANGYISLTAAMKRLKARGGRTPAEKTVTEVIEALGFVYLGRSERAYFQEDAASRSRIFAAPGIVDLASYGMMQGYPA